MLGRMVASSGKWNVFFCHHTTTDHTVTDSFSTRWLTLKNSPPSPPPSNPSKSFTSFGLLCHNGWRGESHQDWYEYAQFEKEAHLKETSAVRKWPSGPQLKFVCFTTTTTNLTDFITHINRLFAMVLFKKTVWWYFPWFWARHSCPTQQTVLWHALLFWKLDCDSLKRHLWKQGISTTWVRKQCLVWLSTYVNNIPIELKAVRLAYSWRSQRQKNKEMMVEKKGQPK